MEFDPTQVPAVLATLFSAGTLGGVIKVVRWTADHDSRISLVERDFAKHVVDDDKKHESISNSYLDLAGKVDRRTQRLVVVETDVLHLRRIVPRPKRDPEECGPLGDY